MKGSDIVWSLEIRNDYRKKILYTSTTIYPKHRKTSQIVGRFVERLFEQMKVMFVKNKKATTVVVTRVFTGKSGKLIDLYANYVAKRIMFENGMIRSAELNTACNNAKMSLTLTI